MSQSAENRRMVTLAASLGFGFDVYIITIDALSVPLIAAGSHVPTSRRVGLGTALRTPQYRRLPSSGVLIFVSLTYSYYASAFCIARYIIVRYDLLATRGVIVGRVVSIGAPLVTQALAGAVGVAHAIAVSAFIWISLVVGYLRSHETVGIEIGDPVLPMQVLQLVPE